MQNNCKCTQNVTVFAKQTQRCTAGPQREMQSSHEETQTDNKDQFVSVSNWMLRSCIGGIRGL